MLTTRTRSTVFWSLSLWRLLEAAANRYAVKVKPRRLHTVRHLPSERTQRAEHLISFDKATSKAQTQPIEYFDCDYGGRRAHFAPTVRDFRKFSMSLRR